MFDNIENLKIASSLRRPSKSYARVENRSVHAFNIRVNGMISYNFEDEKITVREGEMIFVPKGSCYYYEVESEGESFCTTINFEGDFENPKPKLYSLKDFYETDYICGYFADLWKFGNPSEKYKCISLFYNLLSFVSGIEHSAYADKTKFSVINPAVDYLKEHIYDSSLKIEKLHRLCGISDTYFRQIFISRFRTGPQNYVMSKRLSHARAIIDSGDFDSVKEVALSVGYSDPLYFGKVFKKMYGVSPSDITK